MDRLDFLTCRKYLNQLGIIDAEINVALDKAGITKENLCDKKFVPDTCYKPPVSELIYNGTGAYIPPRCRIPREVRGGYYLVPATYQGLLHKQIIFEIFKERFHWFDKFTKKVENVIDFTNLNENSTIADFSEHSYFHDLSLMDVFSTLQLTPDKKIIVEKTVSLWSLYEVNSVDYEIYLNTEFGSLYIPIQAILTQDFNIIQKRMEEYFGWYCGLSGNTDYEKMMRPLNSKEAAQLQVYFNCK